MKIVFFGTPALAAGILHTLIESEHEVIALVTQPDRVKGRGRNVVFSPAKEEALAAGIPVLQPEKVSDSAFLDELEALGADLHVVAAYAQKLPNRLLEMAPLGCINVHPSLLPKYRGAAPMMAAILNGDEVSGVTIMKMAEKMDAGEIILQREMPLDPDETNRSIEEKAVKLGSGLLLEAIEAIGAGTAVYIPQDETKSTYVKQISKEAGRISFAESAVVIERKIRAYDPWPGTYTSLNGKTFKILKAEVLDRSPDGEAHEDAAPGTVVYADNRIIVISCGEGLIRPLTVQVEGKRAMSMEEFLRGRKIEQGYTFG